MDSKKYNTPSKEFSPALSSRSFIHLCNQYQLEKKSVLDIGSSEGDFLQHFGPNSVGVTIIPEHVMAAQANGLTVILGNIEDPVFALPEKFDAVWANNLFEHMNAPHLFLMKVKEFLKPDGFLILGVPVLPYISPLLRLKKFRGAYASSHVNFFTRRTLIETVRFAGWEVEEARLFRFQHKYIDTLLNGISPHIYIVARPNPDFKYAHKRLLSLERY